jgi:FkbM family methyltransferase
VIDLSAASPTSLLGRLLRLPLGLVPRGARVRVLQGPLRGARWIAGSATHGCWLGTYERTKQSALVGLLRPGQTFLDVGANVGFYTLLGSRLVGPEGRVVSLEPLPANLGSLRDHVRMNSASNVEVIAAAAGRAGGRLRFAPAASRSMGRLDESGGLEVDVVSLDELVSAGRLPPPHVIKMDIEGGEVAALEGASELLAAHHPTLLLATHGWQKHQESCALLRSLNYQIRGLTGGDPDSTDELVASIP